VKIVKRVLAWVGIVLLSILSAGAAYAGWQAHAFNASMDRTYDVPIPTITISSDPAVIERGRHVADALMPCSNVNCHGADLAGGNTIDFGPIGRVTGPNITKASLGAAYSDGELARLLRHGLKKDGRSVRFMPVHESNWLRDDDMVAVISYVRSKGSVNKENGPFDLTTMGKVLDRRGALAFDVARRINHDNIEIAPLPTPTAEYGRFLGRLCTGCHGEHLSGGRPDGWPPQFPTPSNLTQDETGLKEWSFDDLSKMLDTGLRKNGEMVKEPMPRDSFKGWDDTERHAIWAYLKSLPPSPVGGR
jgi:hypothetical protein